MAEQSRIAWTKSTSLPESFPTLQLPRVANTVRLEMPKLMARVAERYAIVDVVGQFRKLPHWLFMVRPKVSTLLVTAVLAGVGVALKHCRAPSNVFRRPAQAEVSLHCAMTVSVVRFSASGSLFRYLADASLGFGRVFFPQAIGRPSLCGLAHFPARFLAHLGAFFHG